MLKYSGGTEGGTMRGPFAVLMTGAMLLFGVQGVLGATLQVLPGGAGQYSSIQEAVDSAAPGDTILLSGGVYTGAGNRCIEFHGKDVVLRGESGPGDVVIDCQNADIGMLFNSGETRATVIENLTITRGNGGSQAGGGAVFCEYSSPSLRHVVLSDCQAEAGGAIYMRYSSPLLENVVVEGSIATGSSGGGLFLYASSPELKECTIRYNHSVEQGGGCLIWSESSPHFQDCDIIECTSAWEGGGVYCTGNGPTFLRCTFQGNQASRGGGVYAGSSFLSIDGSWFRENWAHSYGGAICFDSYYEGGRPVVSQTQVVDNSAGFSGSGIVCIEHANPLIVSNTIVGNQWSGESGCAISSNTNAHPEIQNTIVAFNDGPGIYVGLTGFVDVSCCDVFGNGFADYVGIPSQAGMFGNISSDPYFCELSQWQLSIAEESPCLPSNNDCGVLMGAMHSGCILTGVEVPQNGASQLGQAYPNPFNPVVDIPMTLQRNAERVSLCVFDVSGRVIVRIHEGPLHSGEHVFQWDGTTERGEEVPSGIYFCRSEVGASIETIKMTLLR